MGRKAKFTEEAQQNIRQSYTEGTSVKELSRRYECSTLVIYRVINKQGAYAVTPQMLGQPILDNQGNVVNVVPAQITTEG